MQDRKVQYPGRMKLTDVIHGDEYTFDVKRAEGDIYSEGTPYTKAAVLTDETAALLGLTSEAAPNDAFAVIAERLSDIFPDEPEELIGGDENAG